MPERCINLRDWEARALKANAASHAAKAKRKADLRAEMIEAKGGE